MNEAIAQIIQGKTVIVIAHRLHSIMDADQICVMDSGKLLPPEPMRSCLTAAPLIKSYGRPPRAAPSGRSVRRKEEMYNDCFNETHSGCFRGLSGRIKLALVFSFLKSILAKAPIGFAFFLLWPPFITVRQRLKCACGSVLPWQPACCCKCCSITLQTVCSRLPASCCSQRSAWNWAGICVKCPWGILPRAISAKSAPYFPRTWYLSRKTA